MTGFRDFLEVFEIMDVDLSDIKIEPYEDEWSDKEKMAGKFEHPGLLDGRPVMNAFAVVFSKEDSIDVSGHRPIPVLNQSNGVYEITFKGPNGVSLTKKSGTQAFAIYRKMMLVIKKFMEEFKPVAIKFIESDIKMMPIYNLFYKTFLLPEPPRGAGFVRLSSDNYVSKEYIEKNRQKFPQDIEGVARQVDSWFDERLADLKKQEQKSRAMYNAIKPFHNKFIDFPGAPNPVYVMLGDGNENEPLAIAYTTQMDRPKIIVIGATENQQIAASFDPWNRISQIRPESLVKAILDKTAHVSTDHEAIEDIVKSLKNNNLIQGYLNLMTGKANVDSLLAYL